MTAKERLRRIWEQITIYLPLVMMGLLALGTWWLVRNAPKPEAQPQQREVTHEPDYFMNDFTVKTFDATGRLQTQLQGETLNHFVDTDTMEIDKARTRSVSADGRITLASANRALTNGDASEVQLFGNAIVTREAFRQPDGKTVPPMQFKGEFLHVWPNEERVKSNQPVTLTRGTNQFTGDAMEYDNLSQVMQMRGNVKGVLMPSPAPTPRKR